MSAAAPEGALSPLIGTIVALGETIQLAEAGTGLFAFALVILSLEYLRESKGNLALVARALVVGALAFSAATLHYGDFMAQPAKAAFARFHAETAPTTRNVMLLTGLGAMGAGLTFYAGMKSGSAAAIRAARSVAAKDARRFVSMRKDSTPLRVSDLGRGLSLDLAGRLQLRVMTRNPKKPPIRIAKPAPKALAALHRERG